MNEKLVATEGHSVVKCLASQQTFCFEVGSVHGIIPVRDQAETVMHNGEEIPLFRLDQLLGFDPTPRGREHALVASLDGDNCGIVVGGLGNALKLPAGQIVGMPRLAVRQEAPFFLGIADFASPAHGKEVDSAPAADANLVISVTGLLARIQSTDGIDVRQQDFASDLAKGAHSGMQLVYFGSPAVSPEGLPTGVALSITQVLEVTRFTSMIPVPGAPDGVRGVTRWRDKFIPVVDLAGMMELPEPDNQLGKLVIARSAGEDVFGFRVFEEARTVNLPAESQPYSGVARATKLCQQFVIGDKVVIIPSIDKICADLAP